MSTQPQQQLHPEVKRIYEKVQEQLQVLRDCQGKKTKQVETRHQLESQKTENELVAQELAHLEDSAGVFKLIGPVLVSQDVGDAKTIVAKRLDFIHTEIKKVDGIIADFEKKEDDARNNITELQKQMQQVQQTLGE